MSAVKLHAFQYNILYYNNKQYTTAKFHSAGVTIPKFVG